MCVEMLAFAGVALGITLLLTGGALLVRGASDIAAGLGISPMVVGLTIVGFGTSAPELIVNAVGASHGATDIAFGNVVGSNISNLALVLGAAALMMPIYIRGDMVRREIPLLLLGTTMITALALDGPLEGRPAIISRTDAVVLMLVFCIFVYIMALDFIRARRRDPLFENIDSSPIVHATAKRGWPWVWVVGGCALLFFGGEATIRSGVELATIFGVSTTIIGLFVVAIGTSMPELVTSVIAARRGEADLALGNVIGSNLFNSLFVLPISGLIAQIPVPSGGIGDLAISWVLAAMLIPIFFLGRARLGRPTGAVLISGYLVYAVFRVTQVG